MSTFEELLNSWANLFCHNFEINFYFASLYNGDFVNTFIAIFIIRQNFVTNKFSISSDCYFFSILQMNTFYYDKKIAKSFVFMWTQQLVSFIIFADCALNSGETEINIAPLWLPLRL